MGAVDGEGRGPGIESEALLCKGAWEGRRLMSRESEGLAKVSQGSGQNRAGLHGSHLPLDAGQ